MSDLLVPGKWKCDTCGFICMKQNMHVATGELSINADMVPLQCPNDQKTMRAYSWKEEADDIKGAMMKLLITNQVQSAQLMWLKTALITHVDDPLSVERRLADLAEGFAGLEPAINPSREGADAFWSSWHDQVDEVVNVDIRTTNAINNALRTAGLRLHNYLGKKPT